MKKKSFSLNLKAIETVYQGCRFRSRLEARWAIFFDTLRILWKYEAEGYDLDGTQYLPDFWLPEYNCFVEIKGQEPTKEEIDKAYKLCLYSGKEVYVFSGDVWPEGPHCYTTNAWLPSVLWKYIDGDLLGGSSTEQVNISRDMLILREKVEYCNITVDLGEDDELHVKPIEYRLELSNYLDVIQEQLHVLEHLKKIYEERKDDVLDVFIPDVGWQYEFFSVNEMGGFKWAECTSCGKMSLLVGHDTSHTSYGDELCPGKFIVNTPRLMLAYKAARSARFEHGEKP